MSESKISAYTFGPFRLEAKRARLFKGDDQISLTRKRYQILLLLVSNAGQLVRKEEIIRQIWQSQIVEESNITQHIYILRREIEDDPKNPVYIITVPGEGYQFNSNVGIILEESSSNPALGTASSSSRGSDISRIEGDRITESRPDIDARSTEKNTSHLVHRPFPAWLRNLSIPQLAGRTRSRSFTYLVSILGLVVLGAALFFLATNGKIFSRGSDEKIPVITPFLTLPGVKSGLAFSSDGKFLAFTSESEHKNNSDIFVKLFGPGDPIQITYTQESELNVAWSPDGRQLAFLRWPSRVPGKYQLVVTPALGGAEREVGFVWGGLSWSPDGAYLAVGENESPTSPVGIYLLPIDGSNKIALTKPAPGSNEYDSIPRFSPDGKYLAFARWHSGVDGDLYLANISDKTVRQITFDHKGLSDIQWTQDGESILFISNRNGNNRLWQIPSSGGTPKLVGTVPSEIINFSISPVNNTLAYTQRMNDTATEIRALSASTKNNEARRESSISPCLLNSSRSDDSPRFSPDGTMVAFMSDRTGFEEIWLAKSDCTQVRQLTMIQENDLGSPRWSPDGHKLAFDRHINGQTDIFTVDLVGGMLTRVTTTPSSDFLPSWSHDGNWIYYCRDGVGNDKRQIWRIPPGGGNPEQVTKDGGFESSESADGSILYYSKGDYVWQKNLKSGEETKVSALADLLIGRYWDLSGNHLYFVPQNQGKGPLVSRLNLSTGAITQITGINGFLVRGVSGLSISPDETRIATSFINYRFGDIMLVDGWR